MEGTQYQPPQGFFSKYSYDKAGQIFADGKALNGIQMAAGDAAMGGDLVGLSTDKQGNVYADLKTRKAAQPFMLGGGSGATASSPIVDMINGVRPAQVNPYEQMNPFQISKVKLSGVQLDPERYSQSGDGELGANQLYLRPDDTGAYFAQVNTGNQIVAYAYSALQQAKNPTGGPETPASNNQRRQGGNAGGGASVDSTMVSLLGD